MNREPTPYLHVQSEWVDVDWKNKKGFAGLDAAVNMKTRGGLLETVAPLSGHSLMQGLASLLLAVTWVLASMAFSSPTLGSTSLSSRGGVADKRGLQIKVSLFLSPQLGRQGGVRDLSSSVTNCTSSFFHPLHGVGGKQIISRKSSADNLTSGGRSWLCCWPGSVLMKGKLLLV